MSTFEALGFNVIVSSVFGIAALTGFEAAVQFYRNNQLAPRTSARPRAVIKNVLDAPFSQQQETSKHHHEHIGGGNDNDNSEEDPIKETGRDEEAKEDEVENDEVPRESNMGHDAAASGTATPHEEEKNNNEDDEPSYRWPYCLKWIPWALNLTYLQLMEGIPGTGTREDGWAGPKLHCNLDGIILLKFHSLCLKVSILATILCIGIVLPVNYTAPCDPSVHGVVTCENITSLTDFERTTLAKIPPLDAVGSIDDDNDDDGTNFLQRFFRTIFKGDSSVFLRLLTIVLVAWAIYIYACVLIWEQWVECLALRRVYYLEYNHYEGRKEELEFLKGISDIPEDPLQKDRPPYLPHPELRETVPNVGLYSVLYKLPTTHDFVAVASATSSQVDRQLSAATDFFDKIAPNQPGYSSSVAALTILPDVRQVSVAWKRWFQCASKLRRLRFIRKRLQKMREGQNGTVEVVFDQQFNHSSDKSNEPYANSSSGKEEANPCVEPLEHKTTAKAIPSDPALKPTLVLPRSNTPRGSIPPLETVDEGSTDHSAEDEKGGGGIFASSLARCSSAETQKRGTGMAAMTAFPARERLRTPDRLEHQLQGTFNSSPVANSVSLPSDSDGGARRGEFLASVGLHEESKLEHFLSEYEIEQLTVYSREFAKTSAMCCPFGCDEFTIRRADAETLAEMEMEAEEAVHDASEALRHARAEVHRFDPSQDSSQCNVARYRGDSQDSKMNLVVGINNNDVNDSENDEALNRHDSSASGRIGLATSKMSTMTRHWEEAESLVERERRGNSGRLIRRKRKLSTGEWALPIFMTGAKAFKSAATAPSNVTANLASKMIRTDSYAVVTFTSRQAAISARQCLADGSGLDRWLELEDIPTPSIADAPPWNIFDCRGCCRPVTLTLPQEQKRWRGNFVIVFLVLFCFLYTVPLTAASSLVAPERLTNLFPNIVDEERISGFLTGMLYTAFFSICPQIFKALSNFGSGASSVKHAETSALRYYWIFMLATAFTGTSLATVVIEGFYYNINVAEEAREVLRTVASTIPTTVGSTWLNWLIIRYSVTLPTNYLLQFPTLFFRVIQFKCCSRMASGGGPGGPVPYRIYVDSGVAFLCLIGLAPVCPLVAPAAMLYFLVATPMFRWLLIFSYRPQFDGGGFRWPHLHNIFISSMLWSQFLLAVMMALKKAWGATFLAGIALIPTYTFSLVVKDRFERCYRDAALLQTSELDGWDSNLGKSMEERETYRRWLVDCHKAAYVPVCVNGDDNFLTAEPAVVMPSERDHLDSRANDNISLVSSERLRFDSAGAISADDNNTSPSKSSIGGGIRQRTTTWDSYGNSTRSPHQLPRHQRGATYRRVAPSPTASAGFSSSSIPTIPSSTSFVGGNATRVVSGSSVVSFSDPLELSSTKSI